jgi:hypothetical protein
MSTICKLDPRVRRARTDRAGRERHHRERSNISTVNGCMNLNAVMALNELRHDSARTGAAKDRAYQAVMQRLFALRAEDAARQNEQNTITPPGASTPLTGIASPAK